MSSRWFLIKYVSDVWRYEPRNVGVAVQLDATVILRFFAETEPGRVDGRVARRATRDTDNYRSWVQHFRSKAEKGMWSDVIRAQLRRPDFPYVVRDGGVLLGDDVDPQHSLNQLFAELVLDQESSDGDTTSSERETLRARIVRVFASAQVPITENFRVPALFKGKPGVDAITQTVSFRFGYENGRNHLIDPIDTVASAYSFYARAEGAHAHDSSVTFMACYQEEQFGNRETELEVIERYANLVDVGDESKATEDVLAIVGRERKDALEQDKRRSIDYRPPPELPPGE